MRITYKLAAYRYYYTFDTRFGIHIVSLICTRWPLYLYFQFQLKLAIQLGLLLPSPTGISDVKVIIEGVHQDYHSGK